MKLQATSYPPEPSEMDVSVRAGKLPARTVRNGRFGAGGQANQGYTLVEAIIYIAILAVMAVVFVSLLFTMTRSYTKFRLERDLASSASLGLERLVREVRQANSVDSASSPGRLLLNTTDGAGVATTIDFYLLDGTLMVKQGSAAAASTTAARVKVDNLIFRQINTAESSAVKMEMTLSSSRGELVRTAKFYATAVLRGSY